MLLRVVGLHNSYLYSHQLFSNGPYLKGCSYPPEDGPGLTIDKAIKTNSRDTNADI